MGLSPIGLECVTCPSLNQSLWAEGGRALIGQAWCPDCTQQEQGRVPPVPKRVKVGRKERWELRDRKATVSAMAVFRSGLLMAIVEDGGLELRSWQVFDSGRGGHFPASAPAFSPTATLPGPYPCRVAGASHLHLPGGLQHLHRGLAAHCLAAPPGQVFPCPHAGPAHPLLPRCLLLFYLALRESGGLSRKAEGGLGEEWRQETSRIVCGCCSAGTAPLDLCPGHYVSMSPGGGAAW